MMNGTSVRDEVIGDNENTTINHEINQVEELQQQEQQGLLTDGEVDPVEPRVYHELTVNKSFKEANGTMSISTSIHGITSSLNGTTSGSTTSLYTSQGISRQEQEAITISSSMRLLNDLSGFMSTEGIRNKSSLEKGQQQQLTSRTGQGNYGKDIYAEGGHKCHEEENQERGEELTIVEEEVWSDKDPITNCHEREDVRGPVRDQPQLEHDYDDTPDEEESRTDDEDRISENEIIQIKDATPESERQSNDMSEGPSPSVLQMHLQKPQQHLTQKVNDSRRQVAVPREANTRAMIRPLPLLPAQAVTSSATYGASQGFPFYSDKNPSYPVESRDQMRDDPNTASNHSVTGPPMLRSYNDYIDNISPPPAAVSSYQCDSSCTHPDHGATAINSNNKYQRMLREDRMRYMMTNQRFPYYSDGGSFPSPIIPSNYSANYSSPVSHQIVPQSTVFSSTSPIATSRMMNNRDPRPSIQDPRTTPVKRVTPEVTNPPNEVASPSMSNIGRRTPANVNPFKRKQRQEHSTSACSSPIDSSAHFHFPAPQFPPWSPYYVSPSAINFSSNPMLLYNPYLPKSQVGLVPPPLLNCMCIECQQVRIVNSGPVSPNGDNYGSRNWNPKSQFDSFVSIRLIQSFSTKDNIFSNRTPVLLMDKKSKLSRPLRSSLRSRRRKKMEIKSSQ
jgi:hypothetical protein